MTMDGSVEAVDVFVIGGGVNGTGIARDAAGRGYSVMLAEMDDLASGTSSAATKLVHGGLRYLEYYKFRLVHEALAEREVLWAAAPHIIWPLRFVLPHVKGMRPRLVSSARSVCLRLSRWPQTPARHEGAGPSLNIAGKPLKPGFGTAFEFSDGWVMDSRLVALNARDGGSGRHRPNANQGDFCPARWQAVADHARRPADGDARDGDVGSGCQRSGPVGRQRHHRDTWPERRAQCETGQGQPHRHAPAL